MTASVQKLDHQYLKSRQRELRDGFPEGLGLRVHRSLSWLERAELASSDLDAQFIFLWIAFNAAYAKDSPDVNIQSERSVFDEFFGRILSIDRENVIYQAIWKRFSGPIRLFLDNKYVFLPFWNHQNGLSGYEDWDERFSKSKRRIAEALASKDTRLILSTLFDRLYVLRNQLIHGGATWGSSVNRDQVRDGSEILGFLVPAFIDLMMERPEVEWGPPHYPVVD